MFVESTIIPCLIRVDGIDYPTFTELGYDKVVTSKKYEIKFPKGTDEGIIDTLSTLCKEIVEEHESFAEVLGTYYAKPFYRDAATMNEEDPIEVASLKDGGFGAGTAYVFVRRLGKKGERTPIIVLCFSVFSTLATIPFIAVNFVMLKPCQLLSLIMAGVSATLGQFAITSAYKYAPAKENSVFDYTQVIFSAMLGIMFLGEIPTLMSITGYVVIIGVAVFRWRYNLKSK